MSCQFVLFFLTVVHLSLVLNNASSTTTSYSPNTTKSNILSSKATCYPRNHSDVSLISNITFWSSFLLTIPLSFIIFKIFLKHFHKEWETCHDVDISTMYDKINGTMNKIKLLFKSVTYSGIISTVSTTIYVLLSYDKCPSQTDGVAIEYVIFAWVCATPWMFLFLYIGIQESVEQNYRKLNGQLPKTLVNVNHVSPTTNIKDYYFRLLGKIGFQMIVFFFSSAFISPIHFGDYLVKDKVTNTNCICTDENVYASYLLVIGITVFIAIAVAFYMYCLIRHRFDGRRNAQPEAQTQRKTSGGCVAFLSHPVILIVLAGCCMYRLSVLIQKFNKIISMGLEYQLQGEDYFFIWISYMALMAIALFCFKSWKTKRFQSKFDNLSPFCETAADSKFRACGSVMNRTVQPKSTSAKELVATVCHLCMRCHFNEQIYYRCAHDNGECVVMCRYCAYKQSQTQNENATDVQLEMDKGIKANVDDIKQIELPPGWQSVVDNKTGKIYYINHNTQTTQWEKPVVYGVHEPGTDENHQNPQIEGES